MPELLTAIILLIGLLIAASMVHAVRKLKAYVRLRRMRKARRFRSEWNPRPEAMRTFQEARVVSLSHHKQQATATTAEPIRRQARGIDVVIRTDTGSFGG